MTRSSCRGVQRRASGSEQRDREQPFCIPSVPRTVSCHSVALQMHGHPAECGPPLPGGLSLAANAKGARLTHWGRWTNDHDPGKNGLPMDAGMFTLMKLALREISTSTTMVAT